MCHGECALQADQEQQAQLTAPRAGLSEPPLLCRTVCCRVRSFQLQKYSWSPYLRDNTAGRVNWVSNHTSFSRRVLPGFLACRRERARRLGLPVRAPWRATGFGRSLRWHVGGVETLEELLGGAPGGGHQHVVVRLVPAGSKCRVRGRGERYPGHMPAQCPMPARATLGGISRDPVSPPDTMRLPSCSPANPCPAAAHQKS